MSTETTTATTHHDDDAPDVPTPGRGIAKNDEIITILLRYYDPNIAASELCQVRVPLESEIAGRPSMPQLELAHGLMRRGGGER